MKNLYLYSLFAAMFFLSFNSAKATAKPAEEPKSGISASVNFKSWQAGVVVCQKDISGLEFMGMGRDKQGIFISLHGEIAEGTFEMNSDSKNKVSYGTIEEKYTLGKKDFGKVIITKYDKAKNQISGTFGVQLTHAKTGKTVKITQGKFTNLDVAEMQVFEGRGLKVSRNGIPWHWTAAGASVSKRFPKASISGQDNEYAVIVNFPVNIVPGEYAITADGEVAGKYLNYKNDDKDDEILARTGKLVILKNDGEFVSGRFEVEFEDPVTKQKITFTEGEFTYPYYK